MKKLKNDVLIALRYLYVHECCYKSDFINFFKEDKRPNQTYDRLKQQMKSSLSTEGILERKIPSQGAKSKKGQTQIIISLSPDGIDYYKQYETDKFYQDLKIKQSNVFNVKSDSGITRTLYPHLTQQKINIMFMCAGVLADSYMKPSLFILSYYLSTNPSGLSLSDPNVTKACKRYYDDEIINSNISRDEKEKILRRFIKQGIYYTKEEVRRYLKLINPNIVDTFKSVNWNGIFISEKTFFVVFTLSYIRNKRYVVSDAELKNMLKIFKDRIATPLTKVERGIGNLTDDGRYFNQIDAVTVGIGSSHIYTEAVGKKFGKIKDKNPKRKYERKSAKTDILDCHSKNFKRIYSITDNKSGINMLQYLCLYSLEDYHQEELELFSEDERFRLASNSNLFPATYTLLNLPSIYIPVYEIKLLNKLSLEFNKSKKPLLVCCQKEMMETISHCLRIYSGGIDEQGKTKPGLFFVEVKEKNNETTLGKFYNPSSGVYNVYDEDGFIKGRRLIDNYLFVRNMKINSEKDYTTLAENLRRGTGSNEISDFELKAKMYNNIAYYLRANEYIQKIIDEFGDDKDTKGTVYIVPLKTKSKYQKVVINKEQLQISLSAEIKRKVRHMADKKSISSSALIRQAVTTLIDGADMLEKKYDFNSTSNNTYDNPWDMALDIFKQEISKKSHQ